MNVMQILASLLLTVALDGTDDGIRDVDG